MSDASKPVMLEGYASFRPTGSMPLQEAVGLISGAITYARENAIRRLFVDARWLDGFDSPTAFERYRLVRQFALDAQGQVKLALLLRPDIIDGQRFGVMVAQNRGFDGNAFVSEARALEWLLA